MAWSLSLRNAHISPESIENLSYYNTQTKSECNEGLNNYLESNKKIEDYLLH